MVSLLTLSLDAEGVVAPACASAAGLASSLLFVFRGSVGGVAGTPAVPPSGCCYSPPVVLLELVELTSQGAYRIGVMTEYLP